MNSIRIALLLLLLGSAASVGMASSAVGGAAQFNCTQTEAQVAASGAARVSAGGSTIYVGYQQVSANNQNPIVRSFGANEWCRTDYEETNDDGRAYALWWDGTTLFVVFSATGTQAGPNYTRWTSAGWLPNYGAGGGPKVSIILRMNPTNGEPIEGTYLSARLQSNGNTNSLTVTNLQLLANGNLIVSASSASFPREIDRSSMSCTGGPYNYVVELNSTLSAALGATSSGCTPTSPPPSTIIGGGNPGGGGTPGGGGNTGSGGSTTGGGSPTGGAAPFVFTDDRLNNADLAAPVAVYCATSGIAVYTIDPSTSRGQLAFIAPAARIRQAREAAASTGTFQTIASGSGAALYALTSRELQVNSFAPDGKLYEFIFPEMRCDAAFTSAPPSSGSSQPPSGNTYTVQRGDTLARIGQRLGIPWPDLAAANNLRPPYVIFPGQVLSIPGR